MAHDEAVISLLRQSAPGLVRDGDVVEGDAGFEGEVGDADEGLRGDEGGEGVFGLGGQSFWVFVVRVGRSGDVQWKTSPYGMVLV